MVDEESVEEINAYLEQEGQLGKLTWRFAVQSQYGNYSLAQYCRDLDSWMEEQSDDSHAFLVAITGGSQTEGCAWLTDSGKIRFVLAIGNC